MAYPAKPTGDNILSEDIIFAENNSSKSAMTTGEILNGYNNDGDVETNLTSRPDANKFNMFWYQVHNTINWLIKYVGELYSDKLSKTGGTMTGMLSMGKNRVKIDYTPTENNEAVNKQYVDNAINGSMWLGEVKTLSYPTIPALPEGIVVVPCDGREVSRTTYASYFAMVGTTFGAGDGKTTFNIPDYRGIFIRGWDGGSNRDRGRIFGQIQKSGVPNITGRAQWSQEWESFGWYPYTGCFVLEQRAGNGTDGTRGSFDIVRFDASASSAVYQDGLNECRPTNNTAYYVVRIK